MGDAISLPASSLGELEKIIKGYGHSGKEIDLTSLSKLIGINRTSISPNNPFLAEVGIVTSGKKKKITDEGLKLSRALDHNQTEHIAAAWRKVVRESEFFIQYRIHYKDKGRCFCRGCKWSRSICFGGKEYKR